MDLGKVMDKRLGVQTGFLAAALVWNSWLAPAAPGVPRTPPPREFVVQLLRLLLLFSLEDNLDVGRPFVGAAIMGTRAALAELALTAELPEGTIDRLAAAFDDEPMTTPPPPLSSGALTEGVEVVMLEEVTTADFEADEWPEESADEGSKLMRDLKVGALTGRAKLLLLLPAAAAAAGL